MPNRSDFNNLVDIDRVDPAVVETVVNDHQNGDLESIDITDLIDVYRAERMGSTITFEVMRSLGRSYPDHGGSVINHFHSDEPEVRTAAIGLWAQTQTPYPDDIRKAAVEAAIKQLRERDDPNTAQEIYHWIDDEVEIISAELYDDLLDALITATDPMRAPYTAAWMGDRGIEVLNDVLRTRLPDDSETVIAHLSTLLTDYNETDFHVPDEDVQPSISMPTIRGYAGLGLAAVDPETHLSDEVASALQTALDEGHIFGHRESAIACELLGELSWEPAVETLRELEDHSSSRVRDAASTALDQL